MIFGSELGMGAGEPLALTEDHIQSVLIVRRARSKIFGNDLFSDPAWDIILELFAARLGRKTMSLTELALSIETPASTTARWAAVLKDLGLVETTTGVIASGANLQLTSAGAAKMEQLAGQWASAFVSI